MPYAIFAARATYSGKTRSRSVHIVESMHHPTPEIHARSLIRRRRMKSSDASTTADAPSLGGLMSSRCTGHAMTSLFRTSSTVMFGSASWAHGWPTAFRLFLTATRAMSSFFIPYTVMYRFISIAKIQTRFGLSGRSRMGSQMWAKTLWGCGWDEDIFSSFTTSMTYERTDATCHHPAIVLNTPVPPPVNTRVYGFR